MLLEMGSLRKLGLTNKETSAVSGLRLGSDTMCCLDSCDLGVPQMPWGLLPSPTLLPRLGLPTQTTLIEVAGWRECEVPAQFLLFL